MKMATQTHLTKLEAILSEPIASAKEREAQTFERRLAECRGSVVLFGVGSLGKTALQCLRSIGVEPLAFSDSNPGRWDGLVEGVRVLSPKDAADKYGDSALFIVTIWSKGRRYAETKDKLGKLGCRKIVPSSSLRWKFADILMPYFCQDLPHRVLQDSERVLSAVSLWSDDQSREEYLRQVEWRASGDFEGLSEPDRGESYFPSTLFELKPDEFFVDCGSHHGGHVQQFFLRNRNKVTGIMPDQPPPTK